MECIRVNSKHKGQNYISLQSEVYIQALAHASHVMIFFIIIISTYPQNKDREAFLMHCTGIGINLLLLYSTLRNIAQHFCGTLLLALFCND